MNTEGKLESIWVKPAESADMEARDSAQLAAGRGIVGNADQNSAEEEGRQVTIIEKELWERTMEELGASLCPSSRRANLMVSGCGLEESTGRVLKIGDVRIRIQGETKPCGLMEKTHAGLLKALVPEWRGGAYGEILDDGELRIGAPVCWE